VLFRSFALARLNEYEADQIAASFGSEKIAASALLKLPVYRQFIQDKHWNKFNELLLTHPQPPALPYASLITFMENNTVTDGEALAAIELARKTTTTHHDTHPCLSERINALNSNDVGFTATKISAGRKLLGSWLEKVAEQLDQVWKIDNLDGWKEQYDKAQQEKLKLSELEDKKESQLTQMEMWDLAWMSEKFEKSDEPLTKYLAYNQLYPNDANAFFAIGRLLINAKDESGIEYLEKAMIKDELIEPVGQLAYEYFIDKGEPEQANNWLAKVYELEETYRMAQEERVMINRSEERRVVTELLLRLAAHR